VQAWRQSYFPRPPPSFGASNKLNFKIIFDFLWYHHSKSKGIKISVTTVEVINPQPSVPRCVARQYFRVRHPKKTGIKASMVVETVITLGERALRRHASQHRAIRSPTFF